MNKRLLGYVAGVLTGVSLVGVTALAKNATETIQAVYSNIKINIKGVQIEPKDANGNTVEPFIYNGTTYLPVRAVGEALGMKVDWNDDTKTVFLSENTATDTTTDTTTDTPTGDEIYLVDVCPAYDYASSTLFGLYGEYRSSDDKSFKMFDKTYTNGLCLRASMNSLYNGYGMYALKGKYKEMSFECGILEGGYDATLNIALDGQTVKSIRVDDINPPQKFTIPLNNALYMKIFASDCESGGFPLIGLGNVVLR